MKKISLRIYPRHLYLTTDVKKFKEHTTGDFDETASYGGTGGYVSNKKEYDCGVIIYFNIKAIKGHEVNTIAHESLHAVSCIYHDLGIDYDKENDEPAAYLIGFIAGECDKFIKEQNGKELHDNDKGHH